MIPGLLAAIPAAASVLEGVASAVSAVSGNSGSSGMDELQAQQDRHLKEQRELTMANNEREHQRQMESMKMASDRAIRNIDSKDATDAQANSEAALKATADKLSGSSSY
ncbi:hypothetical protein [Ensifer sp. SL37]|uniref:hypothetical protein n=1 Tax=Ensifer sp. SL37 TaxID=2995137 RepID=UPI0022731586|nr:hypothetical protein [Ensifer sp. SL37]MCY1740808.1 hypothetical protein [Ensifer sp. SL37]MCY1740815.1 hypothetical protein [Ensifer sp. SL37]